ncbi:21_t:CDS:2, partial [Dentiscutata heterogama]
DNTPSYFDLNNCLQDIEIEQNNNINVTDTNIIEEIFEINKNDEYDEYNSYGKESSISARSHRNFRQNQAKMLNLVHDNANQMVEGLTSSSNNSLANLLANVLNNFFHDLDEEIPTEDVLNKNNIIHLI